MTADDPIRARLDYEDPVAVREAEIRRAIATALGLDT